MSGAPGYYPPPYIPFNLEDPESGTAVEVSNPCASNQINQDPCRWSSGICACCDDMESCCIGCVCPCFLFAKNAERLGAESWISPCITHLILWALINALCCAIADGLLFTLPGSLVAFYACGYRKALRAKYSLQESPCGDLTTHFCCHLCAICQEYREIRDRSGTSCSNEHRFPQLAVPPVQTMENTSS